MIGNQLLVLSEALAQSAPDRALPSTLRAERIRPIRYLGHITKLQFTNELAQTTISIPGTFGPQPILALTYHHKAADDVEKPVVDMRIRTAAGKFLGPVGIDQVGHQLQGHGDHLVARLGKVLRTFKGLSWVRPPAQPYTELGCFSTALKEVDTLSDNIRQQTEHADRTELAYQPVSAWGNNSGVPFAVHFRNVIINQSADSGKAMSSARVQFAVETAATRLEVVVTDAGEVLSSKEQSHVIPPYPQLVEPAFRSPDLQLKAEPSIDLAGRDAPQGADRIMAFLRHVSTATLTTDPDKFFNA